MSGLPTLALALWGLACSNPEAPAPVGSKDVLAAWPQGIEHMQEKLLLLDPQRRLFTISLILTNHPEASEHDWCESFSDPSLNHLCSKQVNRVRQRPHLWRSPRTQAVKGVRRAAQDPTGRSTDLHVDPTPSPWVEALTPRGTNCAPGDDICVVQFAETQQMAGERELAAALCLGLDEGRWRDECFFSLAFAEAHLTQTEPLQTHLGKSVELCLSAGAFADYCVQHVLGPTPSAVPRASATTASAWQSLILQAESLREVWGDRSKESLDYLLSRYWAQGLVHAYTEETQVVGNPIDHLPAEAIPHVRAAAAWHLVRQNGHRPDRLNWGLQDWADELHSVLNVRAPTEESLRRPPEKQPMKDYWPVDQPGQESQRAISFLGSSRRTTSTDPAVDELLCALEAGVRSLSNRSVLLEEGRVHPDPLVRWTAERIRNTSAAPVPSRKAAPD